LRAPFQAGRGNLHLGDQDCFIATAPRKDRLGSFTDYFIDNAVFLGLVRGHKFVPVAVFFNLFDGLAGVMSKNQIYSVFDL